MPENIIGSAEGLLRGAAQLAEGGADRRLKYQEMEEKSSQEASSNIMSMLSTKMQVDERLKESLITQQVEEMKNATKEKEHMIYLTPELKRGAAKATGDDSWLQLEDGHPMDNRAYSALLAHQIQKYHARPFSINGKTYTLDEDNKPQLLMEGSLERGGGGGGKGGGQKDLNALKVFVSTYKQDQKALDAMLPGKAFDSQRNEIKSRLQKGKKRYEEALNKIAEMGSLEEETPEDTGTSGDDPLGYFNK